MEEFKIGFHELNLGDILTLTPIFKKIKNATLEIIDHEQARGKGVLLEGLCKVTFSKTPAPPCPQTNERAHRTRRMLKALGITGVNEIPFIILKDEEIEWAKDFLSKYKNPVVYTPNNSCSSDLSNFGAQARTFTQEMNETFIDELSKNYTILQFGLSSKFYFFNGEGNKSVARVYKNVINILDLNLRQLAACYKVIGKGLFSDTGDPFLMIAVGGKVVEVVPMNLPYYPYWEYAYVDDSLWTGEKIRAKYICMSRWKEALNYLDFNF